MPFIPNTDLGHSVQPGLEDPAQKSLEALSISNGTQKNGKGLLEPLAPIIFVEATESSLSTELDSGKYKPINVPSTSDAEPPSTSESKGPKLQTPTKQPSASTSAAVSAPLDTFKLTQKWSGPDKPLCGLYNLGNSCFMNSTLQILLHTVPLLNVLYNHHAQADCPISADPDAFCFACNLKSLAMTMFMSKNKTAKEPKAIFANLRKIAPSFRRGRQEDAHEFLRFSIDALQLSAQKGVKDVPEKVADTSWVYRLFGGKFRSRVGCSECGHNSDTLETLLDLSVDVGRCDNLGEALKKFSTIEKLEGKNKYKCEKCNKPVNASKQITVHKAPQALCIHLKRFTPWGRKLTHQVEYSNRLSIQDVMSKGQTSPIYRLYGIILHAGGTPNSGHYYAYVLNMSGNWVKMNDDEISEARNGPPYDHKNAYMLFYMREPSSLDDVVAQATAPAAPSNSFKTSGYVFHKPPPRVPFKASSQPKKSKVIYSDDEDTGKLVSPISPTVSKASLKSPRMDDDVTNPSPSKKPRIEDDSPSQENGTSEKPAFSYASAARTTKVSTNSMKLDLRNVSSESEEENETQITVDAQPPPESQMTLDSHFTLTQETDAPRSPKLTKSKPRAWQMDDSDATPSTTRASSPPPSSFMESSTPSTRQELIEDEKDDDDDVPIQTPSAPINAWGSSGPRNWASGGSSGVIRPKSKTYQSNAKKEQRRGTNPYAHMGLPDNALNSSQNGRGAHNGPTLGNKKNRKPRGI